MNKNTAQLGDAPINKLLIGLSLPAMIGMLVTALYNIVDTIFVAQGIGTIAVAAVGIAFPVQLVLMAIANSLGIGGAAIASQRLGQKNLIGASRAYANVLMVVFVVSMLAIVSAFIFVEPLLRVFGATDEIMPYSIDFLRVLLFGSPFFMLTMASSAMLRAEGRANYQMRVMLTTVAINTILTPLFIFGFDWGIKGAALGTVVAQIVGSILIFRFFFTKQKKTSLLLDREAFRFEPKLVVRMSQIGSSSFIMQVSQSILFITVPPYARPIWGDDGTCDLRRHQQIHGARRDADHGNRPRDATNRRLQLWFETIRPHVARHQTCDAVRFVIIDYTLVIDSTLPTLLGRNVHE